MIETLGVLIVILLGIIVYLLETKSIKIDLPPIPETKERIVPAITQFNPKADVTTVCPVPFAAQTCSHKWEEIVNEVIEMDHEKRIVVVLKCEDCGLLDKTIATTNPAPPAPVEKKDCCHNWRASDTSRLSSPYEQMMKAYSGKKNCEIDTNKLEPWFFRKVIVVVRTCTKCGEIDKTIVSNVELEFEGEE